MYGNQTFDIHGVRLSIAADGSWVRDGVLEALGAFRRPIPTADAAMVLMAGSRAAGAPGPGAVVDGGGGDVPGAEAVQFRFGAMRCYRADDRLVYSDGASTVIVDPGRARAEGTVCRGTAEALGRRWRAWQQPVFTFPLLELLRHRGLYHLHGAAVERDGAGVVLAGDSGCGKTTLTLMLARSGWGFLSDDAVLLRLEGEGLEACALPSAFHVDPALSEAMPELAPLKDGVAYNAKAKRELHPEGVYGRAFSARARPRVLLLPSLHLGEESPAGEPAAPGVWLRRLSPGQAVAELIRSSALVLLDQRAAGGHLESLRRLATGCVTYRLTHGPAALRAPGRFAALVERLLEQAVAERPDGEREDR